MSPLWLRAPSRFAGWSAARARMTLALAAALAAACLLSPNLRPAGSNAKPSPVIEYADLDLGLYGAIAERVRHGGHYYAVTAEEMRARPGYPLRPFITVRPPLLATVQAGLPRWAAYQGSKAGFDLWLGSLGNELRGRGVRTANVYLPLVRTRMIAPTRMYRFAPALTPLEAAQSVVYPLVNPVRRVAPWWLGAQQAAALLFPNVLDRALGGAEALERRLTRQRRR